MLIVLIGEGKMHKFILPQVPSGNYIINDKYENTNRRLIEIEAQDGKWKIVSDNHAKIVNPQYIQITNDQINIMNSNELFLNQIVLQEYDIHKLIIEGSKSLYILCCLPVYEENWAYFKIKKQNFLFLVSKSFFCLCVNSMVGLVIITFYKNITIHFDIPDKRYQKKI